MLFDPQPPSSANPESVLATAASQSAPRIGAAERDVGDFEEVVRQHSSRVFSFVYQMMRHRHDAEDVVQQTFIKAHNNLHRFDGTRPIINWLLTIARRTALNHFRSAKKWQEVPDSAASSEPSPATVEERREEKENLWSEARRRLSQREFQVLWLRFGEGLSIEETSRICGLTQTHIKIIVFRAKKLLMKTHAR